MPNIMSFPAFSKTNSIIENGRVLSSTIDMNNNVITNIGTPSAGGDSVNKTYCDANSTAGIPSLNITLTGTNWNTILANTLGSFDILVANSVIGGPTAKFTILKSESTRHASIQRWGATHGTSSLERLEIRWLPGTGIELRKNGTGHDGLYKVRYFSVV